MSRINGDKGRFHRLRKAKIERRLRQKAMLGPLLKRAAGASSTGKGKEPSL
jgi:hypothetical protein